MNLGFFRLGVMRQYDQNNNNVTAKTLAIKPRFGKAGDKDGGVSGFRALFVGGGHSIAYLLQRAVQRVQIHTSFKALTKVRNKHDKASEAEIARLDKKIQKNPSEQKFKDLKADVVKSRISAAKDAVEQALTKKNDADKNKASYEMTVIALKAAINEKLNDRAKGVSAQGKGESGISSVTDYAESVDASKNQDQPKTLPQLVKELHQADQKLRLANHAAKAAAQRVRNEEDALNYWTADGGVAMRALADAVHSIGLVSQAVLTTGPMPTSASTDPVLGFHSDAAYTQREVFI